MNKVCISLNDIIIVVFVCMNKNSRILPHLTTHYLQKKAYDIHRKKIDYIKHSLKTSVNSP